MLTRGWRRLCAAEHRLVDWRRPLVVAGALVLFVASSVFAASELDASTANRLPPRTTIGGVAVGGLDATAAEARVRQRLEAPLHQPLDVAVDGYAVRTTPWDVGFRVDVGAAVRGAMRTARGASMAARLWRHGRGSLVVPARPSWDAGVASSFVAELAHASATAPQPARVTATDGWVHVVPDEPGRALDVAGARRALEAAARAGATTVRLPTTATFADVRAAAFDKVILVRTGENRLYLYENGQVVRTYAVATGMARYPTPTGVWRLVQKLVDPVWINPHSSWSTSMPARIGPGPSNPLGTRALALNAPGILIHATPDVASIGYSASHGCVRMAPGDEQDLFGRVGVGTPVVIVTAGPAHPRSAAPAMPSSPATPASPTETAAQF
jgi:lipoprotein-anchoring transpeptidase ErfK/SrfK